MSSTARSRSIGGLLLGSIVYGFRCALDHVAWAIYKRGKTPDLPPAKERKVYFPICTTRTIFNDSLKTKLPGASRADIARVRLCQPYIKGKRNLDRHTLWVLDELSRLDKHRTVQPVVPVPTTLAYRVIEAVDCVVRRTSAHAPRGVLEPGAELTRFYVKKTGPDPYIDVETRFALDPAVNEQLPLQEFLKKSILIVSLILRQFSEPSPSIKPIVADLPADTLPQGRTQNREGRRSRTSAALGFYNERILPLLDTEHMFVLEHMFGHDCMPLHPRVRASRRTPQAA